MVWARNLDRLQLAVVLEPDVERVRAREMLFVAMVALGDSLGALAPPEVAITWSWPCTVHVNRARLGAMELAIAPDEDENGAPAWMAVGMDLPIRPDPKGPEPGFSMDRTTLYDEGCVELDRTMLIESYCRHLLTWIHTWSEEGFRPVHEAWMFRANGRGESIGVVYEGAEVTGRFLGLDDHGNMLLNADGGTTLLHVETALGASSGLAEAKE
ncbi:biotin/lipoate--protein ligase family protein [Breoghania sp. L-A4]|uniref:biotin/lipoate--protein ligase family protein n=1 Tax=Breoghania sp. L-A4 TaxID=2304600 RepID=UPI0013C29EF4|nr:biotin/lipoate--protein ligase family protein [Breoghania sp. L-A4]